MVKSTDDLRRRAEERLSRSTHRPPFALLDVDRIRAELEIHQVELEMQRDEIEASRDLFATQYERAPVGLMTFDRTSRIVEANAAAHRMLDHEAPFGGRVPFVRFLDEATADHLQLLLRELRERTTIELRVRPTHGARFDALLVLGPEDGGHIHAALVCTVEPLAATQARPLDGVGIIVLDDEAGVRRVTAQVLADAGARVRTAGDANHAIALATADDVDVLVSDIELGGVSGPEAARRIVALRPSVTVVFMSGTSKAAHVDSARLRESDRMLAKPFSARQLIDTVTTALAGAPATRRLLVIDPYGPARNALRELLSDLGYDAVGASGAADAIALIEHHGADAMLVSHEPPWSASEDVIMSVRARRPELPAIVMFGGKGTPPVQPPHCRVLRRESDVDTLAAALDELLAPH